MMPRFGLGGVLILASLLAVGLFLAGDIAGLHEAPSASSTVDGTPSGGWVDSLVPQGEVFHPRMVEALERAQEDQLLRTIVQYEDRASMDRQAILEAGGSVHYEVRALPAFFVSGTPSVIEDLATLDGVRLIEHDEPLELDLDSAVHTGKTYDLWGVESPNVTTPEGERVTGEGVGVAVVDTGLNTLHEDLSIPEVTVRNQMPVGLPLGDAEQGNEGPIMWMDSDNTDSAGHGSHVASIVAGSGAHSGGTYTGAAPGASLYGFGSPVFNFEVSGELEADMFTWWALAAWDWIYQNGADQDPPIRIITNSWSYTHGPCERDIALTQVQKRLVLDADVTMTFSAGNTGASADGGENVGSSQYQCPWQGNIGVANMDDRGKMDRDGPASPSTARGDKEDPSTWPHISAPGSNITAAHGGGASLAECTGLSLVEEGFADCYTTLSGTSMSAPYVAGVAALILEVRSDLKPGDIQYILQTTAYKYGEGSTVGNETIEYYEDPAGDYRYHGGHYFQGHGLVDAEAAVAFALDYDPDEHPVVYGIDETPDPLWAYGLIDPPEIAHTQAEQEDNVPAPSALVAIIAALAVAILRSHRTG